MKILMNGTFINYYFVCKTKLWLFAHNIRLEDESENVKLGRLLHENSYNRDDEQLIDNIIAVDFIRKNNDTYEIHEIKKTDKIELAHKYQLLFYMYYLKYNKDFNKIIGILNYPNIRKIEKITLDNENEKYLMNVIKDIERIIEGQIPKVKRMKICTKCAYYDFCFV